jgi:hypothetical protein
MAAARNVLFAIYRFNKNNKTKQLESANQLEQTQPKQTQLEQTKSCNIVEHSHTSEDISGGGACSDDPGSDWSY